MIQMIRVKWGNFASFNYAVQNKIKGSFWAEAMNGWVVWSLTFVILDPYHNTRWNPPGKTDGKITCKVKNCNMFPHFYKMFHLTKVHHPKFVEGVGGEGGTAQPTLQIYLSILSMTSLLPSWPYVVLINLKGKFPPSKRFKTVFFKICPKSPYKCLHTY